MMRKWEWINKLSVVVCACTLLTGCGTAQEPTESSSPPQQVIQMSGEANSKLTSQVSKGDWQEENSSADDYLTEMIAQREKVITMGGVAGYSFVKDSINAFNFSQDKYWIEYISYENSDQLLLDISRKQGPDIYFMKDMDYKSLAQKGVFEELTSYFAKSDVVKKENIVESVWRAGSDGDKTFYVIPHFTPIVYVVEKGYTENGVWTIEDYFSLVDKYPGGMLNEDVSDPGLMLYNHVRMAIDDYFDWESRSCNFDSEEFVKLLTELKEQSERSYEAIEGMSIAEQLYTKKVLSCRVPLFWGAFMTTYKDLRDTVLEFCEIVGMPNNDGVLKYSMQCLEMYALNAGSENKEVAWSFFEYLLSEEYQKGLTGYYPARVDVLERALDNEINPEISIPHHHKNAFSGEKITDIVNLTEEDKQVILDIVANCYYDCAIGSSQISIIINEEVDYFFEGTKSAEEVAKIIQSRMSLYLME